MRKGKEANDGTVELLGIVFVCSGENPDRDMHHKALPPVKGMHGECRDKEDCAHLRRLWLRDPVSLQGRADLR